VLVTALSKNGQQSVEAIKPVDEDALLARASKSVFAIRGRSECSTIPPMMLTRLLNIFSEWS